MKIEEGMYVRTEKGEIKKVFQYNKQEDNLIWCTLNCHATIKSSIVKASHNIIDLIEVGDYVNGFKVLEIIKGFKVLVDKLELNTYDGNYYLKQITNNQIKSIVTKEQFENNVYRIGD